MRLSAAWMRRKQFEARLIAIEVSKMLFPPPDADRVAEADMLAMLGITPIIATVTDGETS